VQLAIPEFFFLSSAVQQLPHNLANAVRDLNRQVACLALHYLTAAVGIWGGYFGRNAERYPHRAGGVFPWACARYLVLMRLKGVL
jgi:hypothetical protein